LPRGSPSPASTPDAASAPSGGDFTAVKKYDKVRSEKAKAWVSEINRSAVVEVSTDDALDDGSDEKTYDGYQAIMSANAASSREEELARMKEARMANRAKSGRIDSSFKL
jgi:hypothetical protein